MKTIVVGDVHGCLEELHDLLHAAERKAEDRVILLGDLIDRGPYPAEVVAFAKQIDAECVMGNHEEKALRWRRHEQRRKEDPTHYKNPMSSIAQARLDEWSKIPDEHWDWMATWPKFIHINEKWTGVHAGCMPHVAIEDQIPNELMRLRYIKCEQDLHGYEKYKMASLKETGEPPDAKMGERIVHWTELWSGPRNVVYGHYIWDRLHVHSVGETLTIGIDTGCVHGGDLTALIFEERGIKIAQVKADKTYAAQKPWNEE